MEFIFMLTKDDATVADAFEVYEGIRDLERLRYIGFKDVGLPLEDLRALTERMHEDGRTVMLEVVAERAEDEVRAAQVGLDLGVDWLLGGTHPDLVAPLVKESDAIYCPFPGRIVGHPSQLRGTIDEIAASARSLAARPEVGGLDLLAYRFDGDVLELVAEVVGAVDVPVIAAGSVDRAEQIRDLDRLGVWGFTIGGAVFDAKLPAADASVRSQISYVLDLLEA